MPTCESCGKKVDKLSYVNIIGSKMNVCSSCSSMGTPIEENKSSKDVQPEPHVFKKKKKKDNKDYVVVSDYASRISKAMQKLDINQHQLSRAVAMKESSLSKFLSGKVNLDIDNAKKLESFLEISLVEEVEKKSNEGSKVEDYISNSNSEGEEEYTLGDLIKKSK